MIILFILLIILLNYLTNKNEPFTDYKSQIISPQPNIYKTLQLNIISNHILCNSLAKQLQLIYPIKTISYNLGSLKNIKSTNKHSNIISFIQEPSYYHFISKQPTNNIHFISSIALEKWTLFTSIYSNFKDWTDLKNQTIGTLSKSTGSYIILSQLNKFFNLNINIKTYIQLDIDIIDGFKQDVIDAFFIITSHPNDNIISIHKAYPLKFIGIENLNKDILSTVFPHYKETKIDLYEYDIFDENPTTLSSTIDIICHKNLPYIDGYNLIKTLFRNFLKLKITGGTGETGKQNKNLSDTRAEDESSLQHSNAAEANKRHKLRMKDFNPDRLYLTHDEYTLHKGVYAFYKEIGLITNNSNYSCRYTVGIGKCPKAKLNHFRLL